MRPLSGSARAGRRDPSGGPTALGRHARSGAELGAAASVDRGGGASPPGERAAPSLARGYLRLLGRVALIAAVFALVFTQLLALTQAAGADMAPAVKDGDLLLSYRLAGSLQKDDVVVYQAQGSLHVGRVAAIGGDAVSFDAESGSIAVNGAEWIGAGADQPTYPREGAADPVGVPEGSVYVLGDNRTAARDSRDFGAIAQSEVVGKVIALLRKRDL